MIFKPWSYGLVFGLTALLSAGSYAQGPHNYFPPQQPAGFAMPPLPGAGPAISEPVPSPPAIDPSYSVSASTYQSLLERIEALERTIAAQNSESNGQSNEQGDSKSDDESSDDSPFKEVEIISEPTQNWSGRIHFDYWPMPDNSALPNYLETGDAGDGPEDFIGFRRLRFGVEGDIHETMVYKIEMEFASPDNFSFKDAYLGWDELPIFHRVQLGNQKRPYGLDQWNSSRYNVFMERPFAIEAFNQDARRLGLQSLGFSENLSWNWQYGYFLMQDVAQSGAQRSDNYQSEIAGRLANTAWYDETSGGRGYAHWAISGSAAFPGGGPDGRFRTRPEGRTSSRWIDTGDLQAHNYQLLGLEGVLNLGAFSLVGEYQTARVDRYQAPDTRFGGGYVYAAYWLTGEYAPWDRETGMLDRTEPLEDFWLVRTCDGRRSYGWGAWQVAGRYSYGDFTDQDIFEGVGESGTLALNWWWNSYARLQFNYINGRISERVVPGGPSTAGWYQIFGMRFMVDF